MDKTSAASSGATESTSGDKDQKAPESTSGDSEIIKKYAKEKENWKAKALEAQTELEKARNAKLEETQQFKTLWENANKQLSEAQNKLKQAEEAQKNQRVDEALTKELFKYGLNEQYLNDAKKLVERDQIAIDPDTMTVVGVTDTVKKFYEKFGQLGMFKKGNAANHAAGSSAPNVGNSNLNSFTKAADLLKHLKEKSGLKN